jgi:hypothetical protein
VQVLLQQQLVVSWQREHEPLHVQVGGVIVDLCIDRRITALPVAGKRCTVKSTCTMALLGYLCCYPIKLRTNPMCSRQATFWYLNAICFVLVIGAPHCQVLLQLSIKLCLVHTEHDIQPTDVP